MYLHRLSAKLQYDHLAGVFDAHVDVVDVAVVLSPLPLLGFWLRCGGTEWARACTVHHQCLDTAGWWHL